MRSRHGGIPTRLNRFLSASQLGSDIHCAILSADLAPSSARFEIFRITTVFVNAFNSVCIIILHFNFIVNTFLKFIMVFARLYSLGDTELVRCVGVGEVVASLSAGSVGDVVGIEAIYSSYSATVPSSSPTFFSSSSTCACNLYA